MKTHTLKWWMSLSALVCVALGAGQAMAQGQGLAAVGAVNPANGYPAWYQDKLGLALEPCLVFPNDPAQPVPDPCALAGILPAGDNSPVVFPGNFPDEFFYAFAESRMGVGPGGIGKARLTLALEGAFGNATGTVAAGDQIVFGRLRIRVSGGITPGATYTVTHPYGVNTFIASNRGAINFTDDQGCGAVPPACDFASLLAATNIGPFLRWDPAVAPAAPAGFIGDPAVTHIITGSPFGTNVFRIDGPDAGGTGVDAVSSDQFTVTGKIFRP